MSSEASNSHTNNTLRTLHNPLGKGEDILFAKASFFLGMIVIANEKCVLVYNYENFKLIGTAYVNDYRDEV